MKIHKYYIAFTFPIMVRNKIGLSYTLSYIIRSTAITRTRRLSEKMKTCKKAQFFFYEGPLFKIFVICKYPKFFSPWGPNKSSCGTNHTIMLIQFLIKQNDFIY